VLDAVESKSLALSDLGSVEKQLEKVGGKARTGDKEAKRQLEVLEGLKKALSEGRPARALGLPDKETRDFGLLTAKPVLYCGNTDEKADPAALALFEKAVAERGGRSLTLCGKIEAEILQLPEEDRAPFLADLGVERTGLERVILAAYELLGLQSFFTGGADEVRAWTVRKGWKAPQAAGVIHTDFEKGFIRADVYSYADLDRLGSETALREKGLIRSEGKEYVMRDGDICFFKFSN
ncbi:MAG: DUF933 domain-containing protein, partial [Elusimicrobia bacterium]|nr:DUF933 domain-containing protein [Elusimicrobiota bacterium]